MNQRHFSKREGQILFPRRPIIHSYLEKQGDKISKSFTSVGTRTHHHTHERRSPYQLNHRGCISTYYYIKTNCKIPMNQSHYSKREVSCMQRPASTNDLEKQVTW